MYGTISTLIFPIQIVLQINQCKDQTLVGESISASINLDTDQSKSQSISTVISTLTDQSLY